MGLIQSMVCSTLICIERVLSWTCCAILLMLLMVVTLVFMTYGISVGYHYASKGLSAVDQNVTIKDAQQSSEDPIIEVITNDTQYIYYPVIHEYMSFNVKSSKDIYVLLASVPEATAPFIEMNIGRNSEENLMIDGDDNVLEKVLLPDLLSSTEYRGFWLRWTINQYSFGRFGYRLPLLYHKSKKKFDVKYVAIGTPDNAHAVWLLKGLKPFPVVPTTTLPPTTLPTAPPIPTPGLSPIASNVLRYAYEYSDY